MHLSRRQFLKNSGIGTAAIVGGASLLKTNSAFAAYPAPSTSNVSFVGGTASYSSTNSGKAGRRGMIYDVLLPFQSVITTGIQGKNVIIKPNLVYASGAGTQAVLNATHVDALRGLIDFLRTINPNMPITIAEASATTTSSMMNWCGYLQLLTDFNNITLVDLNGNVVVNSSGSTGAASNYPAVTRHIWKTDLTSTVAVNMTSAFVNNTNYVISIARPKTHNCMVMTATAKNMCMGIPLTSTNSIQSTNSKTLMHTVGNANGYTPGEDKSLAYNLYQIANQMVGNGIPNFAVLDAWEGQQGNGPVSGTSIMQYCAVAGPDFLAVDRLSAKLMGFSDAVVAHQVAPFNTPSYSDMRALVWMSNAGLGNYDLSKINFINGTLANLTTFIQQYTLHDAYRANKAGTAQDSVSWETLWADSTNLNQGPATVMDSTAAHSVNWSSTAVQHSGTNPYMNPQANIHAGGVVSGNEVKIDISLPFGYTLDLSVFDLKGREIRRLGHEYLNAGRYSIAWDCKDNSGARVPNGNYIIKLNYGHGQMADKVTVAR